jgi:hypothetical protein
MLEAVCSILSWRADALNINILSNELHGAEILFRHELHGAEILFTSHSRDPLQTLNFTDQRSSSDTELHGAEILFRHELRGGDILFRHWTLRSRDPLQTLNFTEQRSSSDTELHGAEILFTSHSRDPLQTLNFTDQRSSSDTELHGAEILFRHELHKAEILFRQVQLIKKFSVFYGTRTFLTAFTRVCHWPLSWARLIQSTPLRWEEIYPFLNEK